MSTMAQRIVAGVGANAFGQIVTIAIQLASLPLFLKYWDLPKYGTWLMLSAIPAYLSMADVGMVTAASNKMTMAAGRADLFGANRTFQSALAFMTIACSTLVFTAVLFAIFFPLPKGYGTDECMALGALFLGVLCTLFGGLPEALFKATGRYALGNFLASLSRLGEWGGAAYGLAAFGTFTAVASCALLARFISLVLVIALSCRDSRGIEWGFAQASRSEVKSIVRPALSFMAFPLSNALIFQGLTLVVGVLLGASAVAIFNTYRTVARVATQATGIFSHALWSEFARLFGSGGANAVRTMYRRAAVLGLLMAIGLSTVLYLVGPYLLQTWTHGEVTFNPDLMLLMLGYAAVAGAWHVPRVLLMSTNEHGKLAICSLCISAATLSLSVFFAQEWHLEGAVVALIIGEMVIAGTCTFLNRNLFVTPVAFNGGVA